jgi:hypothetical protein
MQRAYGDRHIRMCGFDSSRGWESMRISFIINRPKDEPGFRLERQEVNGRNIRYTTRAYAAGKPEGSRLMSAEVNHAEDAHISLCAEMTDAGIAEVLAELGK